MTQRARDIDPNLICVTIDVEWASPEVLAELVRLLDGRKIQATFFCTHAGIAVPGHERALHPNFRRNGDAMRKLHRDSCKAPETWTDREVYQHIVSTTQAFCPEAVGVRSHSCMYDSELLSLYKNANLQYDSTYFLPMSSHLHPVWKEYELLEIPGYYMDHIDLLDRTTTFRVSELNLTQQGIKVFDFHPNIVFINASTERQYLESKPSYQDYERLLKLRHPGRGVGTLFVELLDHIATKKLPTATLAELNSAWREMHPRPAR